jgi:pyruvate kinase
VLKAFRNATAARSSYAACLLDTKGPEIRTAMLKGGHPIMLVQGQEVIIEAVGDSYTIFEGYSLEHETRIGLSYEKLCQSVKPGSKILMADGTISIEVLEIISDTELRGKVLNSKELGQRKNCNLPGMMTLLSLEVCGILLWLAHFFLSRPGLPVSSRAGNLCT